MLRSCCPRVDEEANGHQWRGNDSREEMILKLTELAGEQCGKDTVLEIEVLYDEGDGPSREHSEEDQTRRSTAETKIGRVHHGKGLSYLVNTRSKTLKIGGIKLTSKNE